MHGPHVLGVRPRLVTALLVAAALALSIAAAAAVPADAHAFGVRTSPQHGARLADAPRDVVLQFSEPVVPDSVQLSVRAPSGGTVTTGQARLDSGDRVVRVPLEEFSGIGVVSWQVVAVSDGHVTAGEFAFVVGATDGRVPAAASGADSLSATAAAASWLLFAGLALAAGALLVSGFSGLRQDQRKLLAGLSRSALLVAAAGAGLPLLRLVPALAATTGRDVSSASPTVVPVAIVATLMLALMLLATGARRGALVLVALAVAVRAAASHGAAYVGVFGAVLDAVHLGAAAAWAGSLVAVTAVLWRARSDGRKALLPVVGQYARIALWLVVVVIVTGVVSALGLVGALGDLVATRYGRVLTAKSALVAVVLALASLARVRFLPHRRIAPLRRAVSAETALLVVVLAATAVLTSLGPPIGAASAEMLLGPPPLDGPVARGAGLAGSLNVVVAAGEEQLQIRVFGPSGPIDGTEVEVAAQFPDGRRATLRPRPCGAGCRTQRFPLAAGTTDVAVEASAPGWNGGEFTGALTWPPPPGEPALLRAVVDRMRAVPELELREHVSSGPGSSGGSATTMSGEIYVQLSPYAAGEAVDVRRVAGDADAIEFVLDEARMHFTLWLDAQGRVVRERIISPGHEIERTLTYPS